MTTTATVRVAVVQAGSIPFHTPATIDKAVAPTREPGEKFDFDVVGHYSRRDVFTLSVNETAMPAVVALTDRAPRR